ncbi:hypothetical protein LQZ19_16510 [Treponema primitia]|uniref:hypothetical protein n=1 Tax=Treponema primitia TaxID=88058 RepID=UPI00397F0DBD
MVMMRTKHGTVVLDWRGYNKKDPKKLYEELLWQERKMLEEFVERERGLAELLLGQAETRNREIPPEAYRGLMVFRNREYLQKPGMLTRLYKAGEDWQKEHPLPDDGESALARFTEYAAVIEKGEF